MLQTRQRIQNIKGGGQLNRQGCYYNLKTVVYKLQIELLIILFYWVN